MTKTEDKRSILIRVPAKDYKRLEKAAKELSMSVPSYCKLAAFEKVNAETE